MTHIKYLLNCKKFISLMILFSFFDNFGMKEGNSEGSQNGGNVNNNFSVEEVKNSRNIKVLLIGSSGVGKTCISDKLVGKKFNDSQKSTIGASFESKKFLVENLSINLQVWDMAGKSKTLLNVLRNGVLLFVLVYSVSDRNSFADLKYWLAKVKEKDQNAKFFLIGNKNDVPEDERKVTKEEGGEFAEENKMNFVEVSAKEGTNISDDLWVSFIKIILEKPNKIGPPSLESKGIDNSMGEKNTNSSFCDECCSCCPCLKQSEELNRASSVTSIQSEVTIEE